MGSLCGVSGVMRPGCGSVREYIKSMVAPETATSFNIFYAFVFCAG